jgi:hypothetical protein
MTPAEREESYQQTALIHDLSQIPAEYRPRIDERSSRSAGRACLS